MKLTGINLNLKEWSWIASMNKQISAINEKAWDYAIGIVQVEGIKPSNDFLELAEKEKRGELTNDDIRRVLVKKYTVTGETVHV